MGLCRERLLNNGFPSFFKEGTDFMRSIKSGVVKLRFNFFYHPGETFKRPLVFEALQYCSYWGLLLMITFFM